MKLSSILLLLTILSLSWGCNFGSDEETTGVDSTAARDTAPPVPVKPEGSMMVDKIFIGMPLDYMKYIYKDAEFSEEPLYKYGVDSEEKGTLVKQNGKAIFFVWTMQDEKDIRGISILSPDIMIDGNVHVGMTIEAFRNKYPHSIIEIDMLDDKVEQSTPPHKKYIVEFITTPENRIAEYMYGSGEPAFVSILRPEAQIQRIRVL